MLQSHLDGELDEVTARRVADHLAGCPRCSMEAGTYLAIKNSLRRRQRGSTGAARRLREFGEMLRDEPGE